MLAQTTTRMFKTIDRILIFIKHSGISARQFDISIGASNGYTLRMKKNHASVGSDMIETIVRVYPQLNLIWLITGEGEMIKPGHEVLSTGVLPADKQSEIERLVAYKIRQQHEAQLKDLLKEVTEEIEKRKLLE